MNTISCVLVFALGLLAVQALKVKEAEELVDYRVELIDTQFKPTVAPFVPPPAKQDEDVLPITINEPVLEPADAVQQQIPKFQGKTTPAPTCTKGGTQICLNCSTVANCIDYGNDTIGAEVVQNCSDLGTGYYCLNGACAMDANPQCDGTANITFQCTSTGLFPDPWFCDQYHFCTPSNTSNFVYQFTASCETNFTYNAVSTFCDIHRTRATTCNSATSPLIFPVPLCDKNKPFGGSLGGAYYYVCKSYTIPTTKKVVLYPYVYKCPRGGAYSNGVCKPPVSATVLISIG